MLSPPALSNYQHKKSVNQIMESIFSYNSNIMLAAIVSLLLVILFVLILHIYAKWFLAQAQAQARRRRRRASVTVTHVLGPARFQHFHAFSFEDSPLSNFVNKGLDAKSIAAIPLFVFDDKERKLNGVHDDDKTDNVSLECVVCLSAFEDGDIGRRLPKCGHAFHIDCIDMWLHSHSSCPICRAPIMVGGNAESETQLGLAHENDPSALIDIVTDTEILEQRNETISIDNNIVNNGSVEGNPYFLLGCSLQRMLSKVFPSSNVNESNA